VLACRAEADENLRRLIAETLAADPILMQLADELRLAIQVGGQIGARTVTAGDGGATIGGDMHGDLTIDNRPR
jgi:hypothetical protein